MIQLSEITLQRGSQRLLDRANLTVCPGRKVGIIGQDGCGKSSLFQMLKGGLPIDHGDLQVPAQWQVADMAQEASSSERSTVNYMLDNEIKKIEYQMAIQQTKLKEIDKVLADPALYREENKTQIKELLHTQGVLKKSSNPAKKIGSHSTMNWNQSIRSTMHENGLMGRHYD